MLLLLALSISSCANDSEDDFIEIGSINNGYWVGLRSNGVTKSAQMEFSEVSGTASAKGSHVLVHNTWAVYAELAS